MTRPMSGIYVITNTINGRQYVGQSQNIFFRRKQHFVALKNGTHENKAMQQDWNINNRGFRWDVLEYCSIDKLNSREKYWIDKLNTIVRGYNVDWKPYKRKLQKMPRRKQKHYHKSR